MLAVGAALGDVLPEVRVVYVGTGRGLEGRLVPEAGGELVKLDVLPLRGGGVAGLVRGAARAFAVLPEARSLVKRLAPRVVFSVGGYAAGPVALAAKSRGVPLTLLEPNAVLGFTNRLLSPLVSRAYLGFPETLAAFADKRASATGVPLRRQFACAPYRPSARPRILVLGGSQGAVALNDLLPRVFATLWDGGADFVVRHQAGRDKEEATRASYGDRRDVEVVAFIDDMAGALASAELVIGRAGAGALAELCAVGRPGLLVPYPHAADDHQRKNAESLARDGAAVCVPQLEADHPRLVRELAALIAGGDLRARMAERARARGRPDAAHVIARDLLGLAGLPGGRTADEHGQGADDAPAPGPLGRPRQLSSEVAP
jgi:UDP-N-acetylglucosamine--N-acetylmuramyl-(pentapeptide) pyrophosphoryl-undecaprenol N-acetylglucosamine transferase